MVDVVVVDEAGESLVHELWPLYRTVFGDFEDAGAWRDQVWDRHAARAGFRLAMAWDGGAPVGFAYGYTGEHGQWWTDHAAAVLHPDVASDWLAATSSWSASASMRPREERESEGDSWPRSRTAWTTRVGC
jgi:hypothetical protein